MFPKILLILAFLLMCALLGCRARPESVCIGCRVYLILFELDKVSFDVKKKIYREFSDFNFFYRDFYDFYFFYKEFDWRSFLTHFAFLVQDFDDFGQLLAILVFLFNLNSARAQININLKINKKLHRMFLLYSFRLYLTPLTSPNYLNVIFGSIQSV